MEPDIGDAAHSAKRYRRLFAGFRQKQVKKETTIFTMIVVNIGYIIEI